MNILRNIIHVKKGDARTTEHLADMICKTDTLVTNTEVDYEKVLIEPEELVLKNMDLIEKLILMRSNEKAESMIVPKGILRRE